MKKQIKLFTNMTKPLVLFALLLTLGIGEMWGTRLFQTGQKVYFQDATLTNTMSGNRWKSGTNGNVYAYFFNQKDHVGDDVTNWAEGAGKLVYGTDGAANAIYEFTVPSLPSGEDGVWWGVIFTRGTAATWSSGFWNQTEDQYPADEKSLFTIADKTNNSKWTGSWSVMPEMLCSDITDPEWSKEDGLFFTEYSGEKGIMKINCTASQSFQFIVFDGTYYKSYADETNTTWADYGPKTDGGYNFQFQADEAGEYIFQWDKTNHKLWVWEPKARLAKQKYVYFDARNLKGSGTDYWQYSDFTARFWFKYYDSGSDKGSVDCTKASALEDWVYYALVPDDDYLGRIQMNKMNGESVVCDANVSYAKDRTSASQNCLKEEEGKENWCTSWTPQWTTYCPPTTSETFADNSTTTISWQPNTNDGSTSAKAIWVKTGTTLKVAATASKAVADDNMTIKYDFKVNSTSQQDGTTASYTHSASTNNTTYELSADIYTNYNLDNTKNSTKHTQSSIFYKALDTYSVTHTLSGVSKASGREGADAAAYYVAYDATYTANAGYYLPSDITVTIGGVTKTKDTDYTWTVTDGTSGTLNILSSKIDGDVVVTINGIWRWSVAGSWLYYPETVNWDADTYAMGNITKVSSDDVCSVEITLPANTNYTFQVVDRSSSPYTWWGNSNDASAPFYMTYGNSTNWGFDDDYKKACGITTAGAGTYTFTWNITDKQLTVTYPTSYYVTAATAGGGTVTPSSATYMSTSVGGEITATPNYAYYFNGWTSNAGGSFTNASAATTTFKPVATSTVTAAFAERTAFIEANFQVYNSDRSLRTKTGNSWADNSTAIKMNYDSGNNRYYLHTYSTPAELKEQLNNADAYFYIKTSSSTSSIANDVSYHASGADALQSLSAYGSSNKKATSTVYTANSFKFTGSEDGYVIIYFDGSNVWYELECALSYYGGEGATGDAPAARTYYAYGSNQTAAANTYSKTGYSFDHWDTAADDSGSDYAAGATDVAMTAHEVCLHAMWTINNHDITYTAPSNGSYTIKAGDASAVSADISDVDYNTTITLAATPASGYTFTSWSVTGDIAADASSANTTFSMPDNDVTVAATFSAQNYTVTLNDNDGSGGSGSKSVTYNATTNLTSNVTVPTKSGYTFGGYFINNDGTGSQLITDTGAWIKDVTGYTGSSSTNPTWVYANNLTIYAKWTQTVTLDANGGDADGSVSVTYKSTAGTPSAPTRTHYHIDGYYAEVGCTNKVMETNGTLVDYSGFVTDGKWIHSGETTLYTKWEEDSYTITVSAGAHGAVSSTSVTAHPVTASSNFTVTADAGYAFSHWTFSEDDKVTTNYVSTGGTNKATLTYNITKAITMTANYVVRYGLYGSLDSNDGSKDTELAGMPGWGTTVPAYEPAAFSYSDGEYTISRTLTAPNTTYKFRIVDQRDNTSWGLAAKAVVSEKAATTLGSTNADAQLKTSGTGTYEFTVTEADEGAHPKVYIVNPASYQVNYGASVGGSVSVVDGEGNSIPNGGYVRSGGNVTYTATPNDGYTFVGWCGSDAYGDVFTDINPWTNSEVAAASNAYAKFISTNFVIYRTGDKDEEDSRAALDDVESYAGGTISETIEFRMKVRELDKWYSLCLPFTVSAVKVWEDGVYYDLVPFYRTGGTFYSGDYIIRTPRTNPLTISSFTNWDDPTSPTGYLPSKNTPYIIQWHDDYFQDKYVSFFGASGQTIPTSMSQGTKASSDD